MGSLEAVDKEKEWLGAAGCEMGAIFFLSLLFEKLEPVIQVLSIIFPERKGSVLSSAKATSL